MKELLASDDVEESIKGNRKLMGRILIKGESNITSASISKDGSILAVSTVAAIKLFHLTSTGSQDELSIRKIRVPPAMENMGATLLQISPDGQWLCWIQDGTRVLTARIMRNDSADELQITVQPRPAKLTRLRRDIPKHVRLGGLGSYDRRVAHIAFCPDSSILATADLAGYVDTWVMQQGDVQNSASSIEEDDASSDSSDSSASEDEQAESGLRWVRNPKAPLFPKLSSSPVVLSFSEAALGQSLQGEGSGADDYILLAVTNASRVYTFHPLTGSLTKWSRRNTAWKLPEEIRATRDLIKGVVWQGSRIWFYGVSFIFMLDISVDYTDGTGSNEKKGRKRKRGVDSGAGSKMEASHALAPTHVRMSTGENGKKGEWVDIEMVDIDAQTNGTAVNEDDEDEDEDTDGGELQKFRDHEVQAQAGEGAIAEEGQHRKWWHTYKYRPILGVVPLETGGKDQMNGKKKGKGKASKIPSVLEVALVERPKWDVDMPERYVED